MAFAFDYIEEDYAGQISKKELRKRYSNFCKTHGVNVKTDYVVRKALNEMFGANDSSIQLGQYPNREFVRVWEGIKFKGVF